jgi:peptidoglycan/LPS O-acetylase OafA/YrhL
VLDSWRGLCALWVAAYHFRVLSHVSDTHFIRTGGMAVDFFFVLSGFVIWHGFGDRMRDKAQRISFLIRRFGRLYPLHIATLALVIAMETARWGATHLVGHPIGNPAFTGDTSLAKLPANILLIQGLGIYPKFSWNIPSWSISVEFAVCFLFVLMSFSKRPHAVALFLALAGALVLQGVLWSSDRPPEGYTALARGIYGFFLGILCYRLYQRFGAWKPTIWHELAVFPAIIAASYTNSVLTTLAFGYAVVVFAFEASAVSRLLRRSALVRWGDVSYSVYLLHFPMVLMAFGVAAVTGSIVRHGRTIYIDTGSLWLGDLLQVAFLVSVLLLAEAAYRLIEVPARTYFNGVAARFARHHQRPGCNKAIKATPPA